MPGYFWIFPLSNDTANVGVGMLLSDIAPRKINLERTLEACMRNPRFGSRFAKAKLEGKIGGWSRPLASARRKCAGDGYILLGDAASLVDPFSGEGVGNAMRSALIASKIIGSALQRKGGKVTREDCLEYEWVLWGEIGPDVESSYRLQQLGKLPFILDFVIGKAQKSGWVREQLAKMIASQDEKKKANDLVFYLRLLFS
jgi:flavin-dependent dehydrogenase